MVDLVLGQQPGVELQITIPIWAASAEAAPRLSPVKGTDGWPMTVLRSQATPAAPSRIRSLSSRTPTGNCVEDHHAGRLPVLFTGLDQLPNCRDAPGSVPVLDHSRSLPRAASRLYALPQIMHRLSAIAVTWPPQPDLDGGTLNAEEGR